MTPDWPLIVALQGTSYGTPCLGEGGVREHFELGRANEAARLLKAINQRAHSTRARLAHKWFHLLTERAARYQALKLYESRRPGGGGLRTMGPGEPRCPRRVVQTRD